MDMKQLEYYILAFELGSFSKAAEKAEITQQGMSNSIVTLEKEIGTPLFKRTSQGLIPTDKGIEFYNYALNSHSSWKRFFTKMTGTDVNDSLRIGFDIGVFEISAFYFIEQYLKTAEPNSIVIRNYIDQCKQELLSGNIDLGFCIKPVDKLLFTSVYSKQRPISLLVSKNNPLAKKSSVSVTDLRGCNIIDFPGGAAVQAYYRSICDQNGIVPNIVLNPSQGRMMIPLVSSNTAVSFYAGETRWIPDDCILLPFSDIDISYGYELIIRKNEKITDKMQKFIDEYINYEESSEHSPLHYRS